MFRSLELRMLGKSRDTEPTGHGCYHVVPAHAGMQHSIPQRLQFGSQHGYWEDLTGGRNLAFAAAVPDGSFSRSFAEQFADGSQEEFFAFGGGQGDCGFIAAFEEGTGRRNVSHTAVAVGYGEHEGIWPHLLGR